jgi:hypothetical protein
LVTKRFKGWERLALLLSEDTHEIRCGLYGIAANSIVRGRVGPQPKRDVINRASWKNDREVASQCCPGTGIDVVPYQESLPLDAKTLARRGTAFRASLIFRGRNN